MAWLGLVVVFAVIVAAAFLAGRRADRVQQRAGSRLLHPAQSAHVVDPPARYEQVRRVDGPYDWSVDE